MDLAIRNCCSDNIAKDVMGLYWLFHLNVIVEDFILSVDKNSISSFARLCVSCRASHLIKCSIIYFGRQVNINLLIFLTNGLSRFCLEEYLLVLRRKM